MYGCYIATYISYAATTRRAALYVRVSTADCGRYARVSTPAQDHSLQFDAPGAAGLNSIRRDTVGQADRSLKLAEALEQTRQGHGSMRGVGLASGGKG